MTSSASRTNTIGPLVDGVPRELLATWFAHPLARRLGNEVIDLHCHLLPGVDDGARDQGVALQMARMAFDEGTTTIACTPHILPGVYANTGPAIRSATDHLQSALHEAGI